MVFGEATLRRLASGKVDGLTGDGHTDRPTSFGAPATHATVARDRMTQIGQLPRSARYLEARDPKSVRSHLGGSPDGAFDGGDVRPNEARSRILPASWSHSATPGSPRTRTAERHSALVIRANRCEMVDLSMPNRPRITR